jgi:hypothetical protein
MIVDAEFQLSLSNLFPVWVTEQLNISRPTVCVTRWGGDGGTPSKRKMLRRRKRLGIAPESPASGAPMKKGNIIFYKRNIPQGDRRVT